MSLRIFSGMLAGHQADRRAKRYRELIRKEAKIGGELFGPITEGGRREFFCLDRHTWVWHEEWIDREGKHHAVTTRYDVRPQGVLKAQDGQPYHYLTREEAKHLLKAARMYKDRIREEIYSSVA